MKEVEWQPINPENPDWQVVRTMSVKLAWSFAKGGFRTPEWIRELASAGFSRVYEIWENHRQKPEAEWRAYMDTVMANEMKKVIEDELTAHGYTKEEGDVDPSACLQPHPISEKEKLERLDLDGDIITPGSGGTWKTPNFLKAIEKGQAVEVIMNYAQRLLTPTRLRAFVGSIKYGNLPGEEIAEKLGMTYASFRTNKCVAISILRGAMTGE